MRQPSTRQAFTLIELLTVIAIIAILMAILFPVMATVRESARASSCMSNLHQIYVSLTAYKMDEGAFPPALMGYAEHGVLGGPDGCDESVSTGEAFGTRADTCIANPDRMIWGFLYNEQVKNANVFKCADNNSRPVNAVTVAYFPNVQAGSPNAPYYWPPAYQWKGQQLSAAGCPSDANGVIDCWYEVPASDPRYLRPKYFYLHDSYDIGPRIDASGNRVAGVYDRHYSPDWTGVTGATDLVAQLKYANPPDDKTLLAYCTWHAAIARVPTYTAINLAGNARKLDGKQVLIHGPNVFNK